MKMVENLGRIEPWSIHPQILHAEVLQDTYKPSGVIIIGMGEHHVVDEPTLSIVSLDVPDNLYLSCRQIRHPRRVRNVRSGRCRSGCRWHRHCPPTPEESRFQTLIVLAALFLLRVRGLESAIFG
jgi:hypothetical protein